RTSLCWCGLVFFSARPPDVSCPQETRRERATAFMGKWQRLYAVLFAFSFGSVTENDCPFL
ncbi:hypothetical protein, partial [uncultured Bilophila sp.]